jgi:hypothetical protein
MESSAMGRLAPRREELVEREIPHNDELHKFFSSLMQAVSI